MSNTRLQRFLDLFTSEEVDEVYISQATRALGFALVGIFVPIYLYNLGYGLVAIGLFIATIHAVRTMFIPVAGWLIAKIGPKHVMAISQLFGILFVASLAFAELTFWVIVTAMILRGLNTGLFWIANHYNLSHVRDEDRTSGEVSIIYIALTITRALGPLIGGVIATQFGIGYTFAVATALLLLSGYTLLRTPEQSPDASFSWSYLFFGWHKMVGGAVANFAGNLEKRIAKHMWALFIFLFLGSYQAVGLVTSLSLVFGLLVTYIVGERGDEGKNNQQIHLGAYLKSLSNIARPFISTFAGAAAVNIYSDTVSKFYKVPFLAYYYEIAEDRANPLNYILKFEIAGSFGNICSWLLLAGLAAAFSNAVVFPIMFGVAAVAVLFKPKIVPGV